ncbi:MAG: hypothetical protein ACK41Q_07290 [Candidatus Brocadia sp.]
MGKESLVILNLSISRRFLPTHLYLDDLKALREDVAIQMAIGRKNIPDPTTAGDFCRRFSEEGVEKNTYPSKENIPAKRL